MNIKEILAKLDAGETLTAEEQAFLSANQDSMSDEQKTSFAALSDDGEDIDEKALKDLIEKSVGEGVKSEVEKQFEAISDRIVAKFQTNLATSRAKAFDTARKPATAKDPQAETREFVKALFRNDSVKLREMSDARAKALNTTTNASAGDAGYLIPGPLEAEVLRLAQVYGVARQEMRYLPFNGPGNTRKIPSLGSALTVSWTNEGAAKSSSTGGFALVTQTLKKLAVIVPMTEEILDDSAIDLISLFGDLIGEAMAKEEDAQFLAGTGAVWTGVLQNTSTNQVALPATKRIASGDLRPADLQAVIDATPSAVTRSPNAKWYMSPSMLGQIRTMRANLDGTGALVFGDLTQGNPATLLGFPVVTSDTLPSYSSLSAINLKALFFGDLKMAAIYGDKQGIQTKVLTEATIKDTDGSTVINLAQQDMLALRAVHRVGYVLALPTAVTVLKNPAS